MLTGKRLKPLKVIYRFNLRIPPRWLLNHSFQEGKVNPYKTDNFTGLEMIFVHLQMTRIEQHKQQVMSESALNLLKRVVSRKISKGGPQSSLTARQKRKQKRVCY